MYHIHFELKILGFIKNVGRSGIRTHNVVLTVHHGDIMPAMRHAWQNHLLQDQVTTKLTSYFQVDCKQRV